MENMKRLVCSLGLSILIASSVAVAQDDFRRGDDGQWRDEYPPHERAQHPGENRGNEFRPGPQGEGPGSGFRPGERLRSFIDDVGLTDEQRQKLQDLRKSSKLKEMRETLTQEKSKLKEIILKDGSSEGDIMAQLEKVSSAQSNLNKTRVKNVIAFKKILSPDQFDKIQKRMQERRENMRERMQGQGGMEGRRNFGQGRPGEFSGPRGERDDFNDQNARMQGNGPRMGERHGGPPQGEFERRGPGSVMPPGVPHSAEGGMPGQQNRGQDRGQEMDDLDLGF